MRDNPNRQHSTPEKFFVSIRLPRLSIVSAFDVPMLSFARASAPEAGSSALSVLIDYYHPQYAVFKMWFFSQPFGFGLFSGLFLDRQTGQSVSSKLGDAFDSLWTPLWQFVPANLLHNVGSLKLGFLFIYFAPQSVNFCAFKDTFDSEACSRRTH